MQTTITADKDTPILAENKENKTLSVYIYGENYILPVQGGGFSGISSILFQKQFVFEEDEFLEAASYTNKLGKVVTAHTATAKFKILPKDIDLSEADFQCADIHELKLTRAEVPQLLVNTNKKLDENGILTVDSKQHDSSILRRSVGNHIGQDHYQFQLFRSETDFLQRQQRSVCLS